MPLPEVLAAAGAVAASNCLPSPSPCDEPAVLTLDDRGMICNCNRACEALFGYRRSDLVWRHVSMVLPQLADMELMAGGEPNPRLRYLTRIGRPFEAVMRDGECFPSELFLNSLGNSDRGQLTLIVRPARGDTSLGD